ncbi:MAG: hypothetical protein K8R23_09145 [Chthoniobacter sp.]|nr:hypothetical protein [Chthoniobacter sp.]
MCIFWSTPWKKFATVSFIEVLHHSGCVSSSRAHPVSPAAVAGEHGLKSFPQWETFDQGEHARLATALAFAILT